MKIVGLTAKNRNHMHRAIREGATLAYWCSDAQGRPANHPCTDVERWTAKAGAVQTVEGPLEECSHRALHATLTPHRWRGVRVWLVAMYDARPVDNDKMVALRRDIIAEVMPEHAPDHSVGVRIGRKDLAYADLYGADLTGANLRGADLYDADLRDADLHGADLYDANLRSADLTGANLHGAYRGANATPIPGWRVNESGYLVRE